MTPCTTPHPVSRARPCRTRAFSLIEVLLAIFILGVGVISVAALLPAGIAQQRLSVDDTMGPAVANHALSVLRSKLKQDDFGTFEDDFGIDTSFTPRPTMYGDWSWLRPGFLFATDPTTMCFPPPPAAPFDYNDAGTIDIFSWYDSTSASQPPIALRATEFSAGHPQNPALFGIPHSKAKHGNTPPRITFTQEERYYPPTPRQYTSNTETVRPHYVWDCMFRRFQGRIYVAIFVYRVTVPGGGLAPNYRVAQGPAPNHRIPPLPIWLDLSNATVIAEACANGPWHPHGFDRDPSTPENDHIVRGTPGGLMMNLADARQAWQQPRQWIIDQNMNLYRVLGLHRPAAGDPVEVELVRPVPRMPNLPVYHIDTTPTGNMVSDIWYIPLTDASDLTLTPVYATVREL
jgi:type II secretory pathway pseudopilin PulG